MKEFKDAVDYFAAMSYTEQVKVLVNFALDFKTSGMEWEPTTYFPKAVRKVAGK